MEEVVMKNRRKSVVTVGNWSVSYRSGGDIPAGLCELSVFDGSSWAGLEKGFTVKGKWNGYWMTQEMATELCLKNGYLQPWPLKEGGE